MLTIKCNRRRCRHKLANATPRLIGSGIKLTLDCHATDMPVTASGEVEAQTAIRMSGTAYDMLIARCRRSATMKVEVAADDD